MAELIATHYPDRTVHVVGDAAYVGEHLRGLATQIAWTSRLKVTSVLHELTPPHNGKMGRPRTKGARLGTPADLATAATWRPPTSAATDAPTPLQPYLSTVHSGQVFRGRTGVLRIHDEVAAICVVQVAAGWAVAARAWIAIGWALG